VHLKSIIIDEQTSLSMLANNEDDRGDLKKKINPSSNSKQNREKKKDEDNVDTCTQSKSDTSNNNTKSN